MQAPVAYSGPGAVNRPASIAVVNQAGTLGYYASNKGLFFGQVQNTWGADGIFTDPSYANIQWQQFNMFEDHFSDMWCNEYNLGAGNYDFSVCDKVADAAQAHGQKIMNAAYFAWWGYMPSWVMNAAGNGSLLQQYLTDTITNVVGHFATKYPGLVTAYIVVNEPIDFNQNTVAGRNAVWSAIGSSPSDYIAVALRAARAADPNAVLCINDEGNYWGQNDAHTMAYLNLAQTLKNEGVPLDCMGMEAHLALPPAGSGWTAVPSYAQVKWTMDQYASLGMQVMITELDLGDAAGGSASSDAQYYQTILQACLDSPNCTAFNQFNVVPKYNTAVQPIWGSNFVPFLAYDDNYSPTAIFDGLMTLLSR